MPPVFVPDSWRLLTTRALLVGDLVDSITQHEAAVFNATEFGRAGAVGQRAVEARAGRRRAERGRGNPQPATPATPTPTLDNLLVRYAAYNAALTDLYAYMRHGGGPSTDEFATLSQRSPRPPDRAAGRHDVLNVVVDEAGRLRPRHEYRGHRAAVTAVEKARQ